MTRISYLIIDYYTYSYTIEEIKITTLCFNYFMSSKFYLS